MYVQGYMHVMYEVHGVFFFFFMDALLGISGFRPPLTPSLFTHLPVFCLHMRVGKRERQTTPWRVKYEGEDE